MEKKIHIIYGGGKFGFQAVQKLKNTALLIVLDTDPKAEISQYYKIAQFSEIIKILEKYKDQHLKLLPSVHFVVGNIAHLSNLIDITKPEYLIPVAPIHVMKELFLYRLQTQNFEASTQLLKVEPLVKTPKTLFSFPTETSLYVSYAKWDEKCPDNCPAPLDYCPIHRRTKPKPVFTILQENFENSNFLGFISHQLEPGLGGISIHSALLIMKKFIEKIKQLEKNQVLELIFATACRCHGVIDKINIQKK